MDGGMASKIGEAFCGGGGREVGSMVQEGASMVQIFLDSSWFQHFPKI